MSLIFILGMLSGVALTLFVAWMGQETRDLALQPLGIYGDRDEFHDPDDEEGNDDPTEIEDDIDDVQTCRRCDGECEVDVDRFGFTFHEPCPLCEGTGIELDDKVGVRPHVAEAACDENCPCGWNATDVRLVTDEQAKEIAADVERMCKEAFAETAADMGLTVEEARDRLRGEFGLPPVALNGSGY